jgi:hypothetical protein
MTTPPPSDREATLRLLVELATTTGARCWDGERAETILRHQSSAEELRALGVDESLISYLWPQ